jgi:hypothetical protein
MGKVINMIELLDNYFSAHHSVSISHFSHLLFIQHGWQAASWSGSLSSAQALNFTLASPFPLPG